VLLFVGADGGESPKVDMESVQARYDAVKDVRASFEQTSYVASLGKEDVSRGRVVVARPGRMRWEYTEPEPSVIVVDRTSVQLYSPSEKKLEIMPLNAGALSPTALGFLLGEARLRDTFRVERTTQSRDGGEIGLVLVPLEESGFDSLEIRFERDGLRLRESVLLDLFGNRTRVRFDSVVENSGVEENSFTIAVPDETEIIDLR
jgi:outer membrane lipoprotein-sorting protein